MPIEFPKTAKGPATVATEADIQQDEHGLTNPNLHRRIDTEQLPQGPGEVAPRQYEFNVLDGVHSYRLETIITHDEESTTSEIP